MDNWKSYKKLAEGKFLESDVLISLTNEKSKTNEVLEEVINLAWNDNLKTRKSLGQKTWDSVSYSLMNLKQNNNILKLEIGETTYKTLSSTNRLNILIARVFGEEYVSKGLVVESILLTKNNKLVLGKRNTGTKAGLETQSVFGGTASKNELEINNSNDLFLTAKKEILEEVGLESDDIKEFYLNFIFKDWKYIPVFVFIAVTNLDEEEINSKFEKSGAKDEHTGLVFDSEAELKEKILNEPERFNDISLSGLDLYFKQ